MPAGRLGGDEGAGHQAGDAQVFVFDVIKGEPHVITVRERNAIVRLGDEWKGLRSGGLLYGKLHLADRVYGRFAWVRTGQCRSYRALGSAGPGKQWHHIVEQTPGNVARCGLDALGVCQ